MWRIGQRAWPAAEVGRQLAVPSMSFCTSSQSGEGVEGVPNDGAGIAAADPAAAAAAAALGADSVAVDDGAADVEPTEPFVMTDVMKDVPEWMHVHEDIKPPARDIIELLKEDWPSTDEEERKYIAEFMQASSSERRKQKKLRSVSPDLYGRIRMPNEVGSRASVRFRNEHGLVPCVVFGRTKNNRKKPLNVLIPYEQIFRQYMYHGHCLMTTIFRLYLEGRDPNKPIKFKFQQMQLTKLSHRMISATLVRWSPGKKTRMTIPVRIIGVRDSIGVKRGGTVMPVLPAIKCVYDGPGPLPREIVVDTTKMDIGDRVRASDIELPPNTRLRRPEVAITQVLVTVVKN